MKKSFHFMSRLITTPLLIAIGIVIGYVIATKTNPLPVSHPSADKKILYWYDPMLPDQHFDHPGKSSMNMEMVPKYADLQSSSQGVRIDPRIMQNTGIRLGVVEKTKLSEKVSDAYVNDIFALQENINRHSVTTPAPAKTHEGLVVPSEAVLATGRHTFVITVKPDGYFQPIEVVIGQVQNNKTEIISGLHEGDKIVISGQFLIDSEANFSSAINRLNNTGETP